LIIAVVNIDGSKVLNMLLSFWIQKQIISTQPVLGYPNNDKDFSIFCDASGVGIGAVLCQLDPVTKKWNTLYVVRVIHNHV
jgi:hypothetical protein